MGVPFSRLGTRPAVVNVGEWRRVGWFRSARVDREVGYLDWTIDDVALRELVAWPNGDVAEEVTPVGNVDAMDDYRRDYLRALLGEPVGSEWAVMPDGRVPLLVCPVDFDLSCPALTAQLVRDGQTVQWRDLAWQVADQPVDFAEQGMSVISLVFDRQQYDSTVRALLHAQP